MKGNWKKQLADLLKKPENLRTVRGDRRASDGTQEARANILYLGFEELKLLGYRFDTIHSFRQKHMRALVNKWLDEGKSASTIQNRLTTFRVFANWIGKEGLIGSTSEFVEDVQAVRRTLSAQVDKSWSGNGVDIDKKLAQIRAEDERAGLMLLAGRTWGLRRLEMVCIRPHATVVEGGVTNILAFTDVSVSRDELKAAIAASGSGLPIKKGTKGGRYRELPLDTPEKLAVLKELQSVVRDRDGHLGWPGKSLQANAKHLSYLARKFGLTKADLGVTLHGLRHEVANNEFERLSGVQSAIRGGKSPAWRDPGRGSVGGTAAWPLTGQHHQRVLRHGGEYGRGAQEPRYRRIGCAATPHWGDDGGTRPARLHQSLHGWRAGDEQTAPAGHGHSI
ncbi:phage integrase N-terminal domain-containing protein [Ralstonia sp. SET104]|uniref:phage integrase N-terminal domain-containing protein n=1 Tax=Ralstonia sp. SET104 TaxID=2448774 RepID=UPI000FFAD044|nr:integrase domain-containing protein [Ralstonia sp. SET104]GCB06728.1 hypothetical protein PSUB009319_43590 [Ralstonia sp. SET104]